MCIPTPISSLLVGADLLEQICVYEFRLHETESGGWVASPAHPQGRDVCHALCYDNHP